MSKKVQIKGKEKGEGYPERERKGQRGRWLEIGRRKITTENAKDSKGRKNCVTG